MCVCVCVCVCGEMITEAACGAAAALLYVNTLGADFCYDDRYTHTHAHTHTYTHAYSHT